MSVKPLNFDDIFPRNRRWAARQVQGDPAYFTSRAQSQSPSCLWTGCADSRVPATKLLDLDPGDVFVHRNIANVVAPGDLNTLSVLHFGIGALGISDVIVCGHYGCGGVLASMSTDSHGLMDPWLDHIRKVQAKHAEVLAALGAGKPRQDRLCELNVVEQVNNVCATEVLGEAWAAGDQVAVHGVIYNLHDGTLRHLCSRLPDQHPWSWVLWRTCRRATLSDGGIAPTLPRGFRSFGGLRSGDGVLRSSSLFANAMPQRLVIAACDMRVFDPQDAGDGHGGRTD